MSVARALLLLAVPALAACGDDTAVRLRFGFPDCTINPEQVSTLVVIIEAADGSAIEGLERGKSEEDGIDIEVEDVDADGILEVLLRAERADHDIKEGFAIRLLHDGPFATDMAVDALAGNDDGRQIGRLAGDRPTFRFDEGEEHTVDLPLICMCNGMPACEGTCEAGVDPHCRPPDNRETYCKDGLDNDTDPFRDCVDPECFKLGPCANCDVEICQDGVDNDCDDDTDCGDESCADDPACAEIVPEICDNGGDDDRDGKRDCLDLEDCEDDPACTGECRVRDEVCDNRQDDDCDQKIDCVDPDCEPPPEHELACADGFDDDCDNRVDCADADCYGVGGCECRAAAEHEQLAQDGCHNGVDDDCDGAFDCEDDDCEGAAVEDCADTVDNDCDGANNCADSDCHTETAQEICDDLYDNDCDGNFDCEQSSCLAGLRVELRCGDFLDNDCDEKVDCDDPDCDDNPLCTGTSTS